MPNVKITDFIEQTTLDAGDFLHIKKEGLPDRKISKESLIEEVLEPLTADSSGALVGGVPAGQLAGQALYSPTTSGYTVIDLHYGALRGRGLPATETTSVGLYNVAISAAAGSTSITLTANLSTNFSVALVPEQMITYLGDNGEYYAAVIFDIVGSVLQLKAPLEATVSAGTAKVTSFQANEAHPNEYGYRAIADYALRVPKTQYKRVAQLNLSTQIGSASIVTSSANDINNTGSGSVLAKSVTCPTAGSDGISGVVSAMETGAHVLNFVINGNCSIVVSNGTNSTTTQVSSQEPRLVEVPCFVSGQNRNISVVLSAQADGGSFILNQFVDLLKVVGVAPDLNKGVHVMLGDSWFEQEGIWDRLKIRLPNATIYNEGTGGERADQMAARFETDVAAYNPDVVWFIAGTNEYYQGVLPDFFSYQVNRIKSLCAEIGAHLMIFTCSVGSAQLDATRFNLSRRLATETDYFDTDIIPDIEYDLINIQQQSVPNGSTVQLANLGSFDSEVTVLGYYINGAGMKIGRKSSLLGLPSYLNGAGFSQNTLVTTPETFTYSGPQFIEITGENTSGVTQDYLGYIKVRRAQ